jgi:tetratricopeptide (TPR) repeat protein
MLASLACPGRADLERLLLGEMHDMEMEIVEGHVGQCMRCLRLLRTLQTEDALIATVRAGGKIGPLPQSEIDGVLMDRLCQLVPRSRNSTLPDNARREAVEGLAEVLAPATAADELGRIGPYGILRVLGSGGMGIVCTARQDRPQRIVALKMLLADPRAGRQRLERFRSESAILARLRHANIVHILEVGEHAGHAYFTMEFAEGGSLAQKLATAPLSAGDAAELTRTLARTIDAVHQQGIVHRDLKPSNVLLAGDGAPRIADFGLAKELAEEARSERTETGAILGTPGYMAPEQAAGNNRDIGPAVDVYALGAILYECLTGRPPFKAATLLETLEQVRTQEPVPPSRLLRVPTDLQTICLKCLAKEPGRRYGSAAALADDLDRYLQGKPIQARLVPPWERAWKWTRRKPTAAALMAVSVLSILALALGLIVHDRQMHDALEQAKSKEAEAQSQRQRARAYYHQARDTLDQVIAQFEDYRVGEAPLLKELQRRQIEKALEFYVNALKVDDDADPEVRHDTAYACWRAGDLQLMLGRVADAERNYDRAIDLLEGLPDESRRRPRNQHLLACCFNNRGLLANRARRWDDAERDHGKAREILEALAAAEPANLGFRANLAETEHFLGSLFQVTDKLEKAEPFYERAQTLYAALIAERPADEAYQSRQIDLLTNLGLLYQNTKRLKEATRAYESAEALLVKLLERHPSSGEYSLSLAALYSNWAQLLRATDQAQDGLQKLNRAAELSEPVLKQEPRHEVARARVYAAHGARAQAHEALKSWAAAVPDWDRVVELETRPHPWLNRVLRAVTMARAGLHVRVAAEVEALRKDPQITPDGLYALACALALSAEKVPMDSGLDAGTKKALAERYAVNAVAQLRDLQTGGYFQTQDHALRLATDPDLLSLRGRADFQQLLAQGKTDNK